MVIDCRDYKGAHNGRNLAAFVDGREIQKVWYVDTDEGLVKTLAIHQFEGRLDLEYAPNFNFGLYSDWDLETHNDMVSRTIRGRVELRPTSSYFSLI